MKPETYMPILVGLIIIVAGLLGFVAQKISEKYQSDPSTTTKNSW